MEEGSKKELVCLIVSGAKRDVIGGGLKKNTQSSNSLN